MIATRGAGWPSVAALTAGLLAPRYPASGGGGGDLMLYRTNARTSRGARRAVSDDTLRRLAANSDLVVCTLDELLADLGPEKAETKEIFGLLAGRFRGKPNRPVVEYLKGDEDREARVVLAKLLRSDEPLSRDLRNLLAALFDPGPSNPPVGRQLVFRHRKTSARHALRDLLVNTLMAMQVGAGMAAKHAAELVGEKLAMEPDAIRKVWEQHRKRPL